MLTNKELALISKPKEKWIDIPGYDGAYQISSNGRVKTIGRKGAGKPSNTRLMKINKIGRYGYVDLMMNGNRKTVNIDKLVSDVFGKDLDY